MSEQIKKLIQYARTKEALELLAVEVPEASVLLTTFNDATKRYNLGLIDYKEFSQKQSQVTYSALEYLQALGTKKSANSPLNQAT